MLKRLTLLVLLLGCFTLAAQANTVTLKLTGVGPGSMGGPNSSGGVYTYPYYFNINGAGPVALLCDDYTDEVKIGESWVADVNSILAAAGGAGWFHLGTPSATQNAYYEAAWLYLDMLTVSPPASQSAIDHNYAIWHIFDGSVSLTSAQNTLLSNAVSAVTASGFDPNSLASVQVYTWDGDTSTILNGPKYSNGSPKPPQEYFGVPEPGSLVLLGSGMLGFFFRRKRA